MGLQYKRQLNVDDDSLLKAARVIETFDSIEARRDAGRRADEQLQFQKEEADRVSQRAAEQIQLQRDNYELNKTREDFEMGQKNMAVWQSKQATDELMNLTSWDVDAVPLLTGMLSSYVNMDETTKKVVAAKLDEAAANQRLVDEAVINYGINRDEITTTVNGRKQIDTGLLAARKVEAETRTKDFVAALDPESATVYSRLIGDAKLTPLQAQKTTAQHNYAREVFSQAARLGIPSEAGPGTGVISISGAKKMKPVISQTGEMRGPGDAVSYYDTSDPEFQRLAAEVKRLQGVQFSSQQASAAEQTRLDVTKQVTDAISKMSDMDPAVKDKLLSQVVQIVGQSGAAQIQANAGAAFPAGANPEAVKTNQAGADDAAKRQMETARGVESGAPAAASSGADKTRIERVVDRLRGK
jgi:hypothetical protein